MARFVETILGCFALCLTVMMVMEARPTVRHQSSQLDSWPVVRSKHGDINRHVNLTSDCCSTYSLFNCTGTEKFDPGLCLDCGTPDSMGFCGVGSCNSDGCGCEGKCRRATDNPHAKHLEDENVFTAGYF